MDSSETVLINSVLWDSLTAGKQGVKKKRKHVTPGGSVTADKHRVCGTHKAVQMTYRDALDPDVRVQREAVGRGVVSRQLGSEAKHRHALLQIVARYHSAQGLDGVEVLVGLSHTQGLLMTGRCCTSQRDKTAKRQVALG